MKVKTLMTRTISSKNHFEFLFYAFISFYLLLVLESFYTDGAAAVSEQRRRRKSVAHLASPPSHNRALLVNHPLDTRIPIRLTLSVMSRTTRESSRCFEMLQVFVTHLRGRFDAARHHQKNIYIYFKDSFEDSLTILFEEFGDHLCIKCFADVLTDYSRSSWMIYRILRLHFAIRLECCTQMTCIPEALQDLERFSPSSSAVGLIGNLGASEEIEEHSRKTLWKYRNLFLECHIVPADKILEIGPQITKLN